MQRPNVQVLDFFRRKQRETPVANGAAGKIIRKIPVRGNSGSIAQPEVDQRRKVTKIYIIFSAKPRQTGIYLGVR